MEIQHFDAPVLGPALFPPIQYFARIALYDKVFIEGHCHYTRQTYRNRYLIAGPSGVMPLTVPVEKVSGKKIKTKDIRVSYDTPWNDLHWKSIVSAYNASPYFQFYDLYLEPLFSKKWEYLIDLDLAALDTLMECLEIKTEVHLTKEFEPSEQYPADYREIIHPKKPANPDSQFISIPYRQVFEQRQGFLPNLSILDLLFNKGPESLIVLQQSLK